MVRVAPLDSSIKQQPLPVIIDELARLAPDRHMITLAQVPDSLDGARLVTTRDMARAVDRAATWLDKTLGKAKDFPAYAFMANNYDLRYVIFLIAGIKTGHKTFFPSPRNSEEFHLHLINKIGIKEIVSSIPVGPYAAKANCSIIEPPSLDEFLADGEVEHYRYTKTAAEALNDQICVLHSSGSTGPPKPINWTNGYIDASRKVILAANSGRSLIETAFGDDELTILTMPLFHAAGTLVVLLGTILMETPTVAFPPSSILTADNLTSFIKTFKPVHGIVPPSLLEDIANDEDKAAVLESLQNISFGGAGLADEAGEKLRKHVPIYTAIGSTEASLYPILDTEAEETNQWLKFEVLPGATFRLQEDGLSEFVFERTTEFDWPVFHTFPDQQEYATNDLYEPHPTLPNHWRLVGRKDDVLVLSNGEKVVPLPMESTLRMAPEIDGALYFGHGKFTVGALVELNEDLTESLHQEELIQRLRPYALRANELAPAFGRLTKEMVIFTSKGKPMRRAPKGSLLRRATLALYTQEIEDLYLNQEAAEAVTLVKGLDLSETEQVLLKIFTAETSKPISVDEDLFQSVGTDSMQVIAVTRQIKASLQAEAPEHAKKVAAALIYANPTISQLARAVRSLVLTGKADVDAADASVKVKDMIKKYTEGMAEAVPLVNESEKYNVLLTGSTGSLGSYMLSILIKDPAVGKIFALNRSNDSESRQVAANTSRGLSTDMSKVVFLKASLGNKNLGLSPQDYQEVLSSTSLIIHNAWPVNFNQSLESFEPHIRGVRNFIDLSAASPLRPHIVFVSSIGTVAGWEQFYPGQPKPEAIFEDSRPAQGGGYGESKFVSEQLLAAAVSRGINSTVARVGQVAGPVESIKGEWGRQEWVPSIVFSSAHMGTIPSTIGAGVSNWIPVDSMAKIVVELGENGLEVNARSDGKVGKVNVFNLTNPNESAWSDLVPAIQARIPSIKSVVTYQEWFNQVYADSENSETDASQHPAVKLVDFFSSLAAPGEDFKAAPFETAKAVATSKTMASVHAVNEGWMNTWMTQWGF